MLHGEKYMHKMRLMRSTMMRVPLSINHFLERAGTLFGGTAVVSRLPDKSLRRHTYADFHARTRRLAAALHAGLTPILCVGETLAERDAGRTEAVLRAQVRAALEGIERPDGLVIAYEPVWAIGTGRAATAADASGGNAVIRQELAAVLGEDVARATRIQYGGSVTPENAAELLGQPEVDGALVGGASLKAAEFHAIAEAAA